MAEMSRGFNFDKFDEQIADALEDNDQAMRPSLRHLPGAVGGVACAPTLTELPDPPEAV